MVSESRTITLDTSVQLQRKIQMGLGCASLMLTAVYGAVYLLQYVPKSVWTSYVALLIGTQIVSFITGVLFERARAKQ